MLATVLAIVSVSSNSLDTYGLQSFNKASLSVSDNNLAGGERTGQIVDDLELFKTCDDVPEFYNGNYYEAASYDYQELINASKARKISKGKGVRVAVIDSGIDSDHEDLRPVTAATVIPDEAYGTGGFMSGNEGPEDHHGHGTQVAGIIAARDNGKGVTGIAPEASVISIKALDQKSPGAMPSTGIQELLDAIEYAVSHNVDIINLSIGMDSSIYYDNIGDPEGVYHDGFVSLDAAIANAAAKGIIIVCSAGNNRGQVMYPAIHPDVIAVAAYDTMIEDIAEFSAYGPEVDVIAPGTGLNTTTINNDYRLFTGTSAATPVVTGAIANLIALARAAKRSVTPSEVRDYLRQSSQKLNGQDDKDDRYGYGMIDALALLKAYKKAHPSQGGSSGKNGGSGASSGQDTSAEEGMGPSENGGSSGLAAGATNAESSAKSAAEGLSGPLYDDIFKTQGADTAAPGKIQYVPSKAVASGASGKESLLISGERNSVSVSDNTVSDNSVSDNSVSDNKADAGIDEEDNSGKNQSVEKGEIKPEKPAVSPALIVILIVLLLLFIIFFIILAGKKQKDDEENVT